VPGVVRPIFRWAAQKLDEAFAWYLSEHVLGGYRFLMQNYDYGDKVYIFGFSRGAYTARALAGMLYKVGLLSKDNVEEVPFAYKLYKANGNDHIAQGFKDAFCRIVPIDFVGVWDTVGSVGFVVSRSLPFVQVNTTIRVFRQALSLDEHRAKFRPNLYHRTPQKKSSTAPDPNVIKPGTDEIYETDMKEVWFAGCHSDIGGGNWPDNTQHSLSNISLRWMIEQIVLADCNILFNFDAFDRLHIPRTIGQQKYASPAKGDGPLKDIDNQDAVQKITDQLWKNPLWWILEIFPTSYTYQNAKGKWVTSWWPHLFRGRRVPPNPVFHTSVKIRMDDARLKYKPKAHYEKDTETYAS